MRTPMLVVLALLSLLLVGLLAVPVCAETPRPHPTPLPLNTHVPPEHVLKPDVGIGNIPFGASVEDVEKVFGRGELLPEETSGLETATLLNLTYKEKGIMFSFLDGILITLKVGRPGFATPSGVQVGGDVGDLIREFGSKYEIEKSILQIPEPGQEEYQIFYKTVSASVKGKIITELRIRTQKKLKPPKKK